MMRLLHITSLLAIFFIAIHPIEAATEPTAKPPFEVLQGACSCSMIPPSMRFRARDLRIDSVCEIQESKFALTFRLQDNYPLFIKMEPAPGLRSVFYAQQAVWDVAPQIFEGYDTYHVFASEAAMPTRFNCGKFLDKIEQCNDVVFVHLLSPDTLRSYPSQLKPADIHCERNVRSISLTKVNLERLEQFRRERSDFLRKAKPDMTHADLMAEQAKLALTYDDVFLH